MKNCSGCGKCAWCRAKIHKAKLARSSWNWGRADVDTKRKILEAQYLRKKERRKVDPGFRILESCRARIWSALRGKTKSSHTVDLLGCEIPQLKVWLEKTFLPGMSWDNYGQWEIDHKVPCASFDLTSPEQQRECFHYSNLQALWKKDNLLKSAKV